MAQTPAGFLIDRINARLALVAGLLLGAAGVCRGRPGQFVLGADRDVRRASASATPSITRRTMRCCRATSRRSASATPIRCTPSPACSAAPPRPAPCCACRPVRLARRFSRRRGAGPRRRADAAVPARRRAASDARSSRARRAPRRPTGGCCSTAPILMNFVFFLMLRVRELRLAELLRWWRSARSMAPAR